MGNELIIEKLCDEQKKRAYLSKKGEQRGAYLKSDCLDFSLVIWAEASEANGKLQLNLGALIERRLDSGILCFKNCTWNIFMFSLIYELEFWDN